MTRNKELPSPGNSKTCLEFVEDEIGLVPTLVTIFYSPLMEISDDTGNGSRSLTPTKNNSELEDKGWLDLVQTYSAPEGKKVHLL